MKNTMILLLLIVSVVFLGFIYFQNFREPGSLDKSDGSFAFYEPFPSEFVTPRPVDVWLQAEQRRHAQRRRPGQRGGQHRREYRRRGRQRAEQRARHFHGDPLSTAATAR